MEDITYQVRVTGIPEKLKIAALLRLIHSVKVRTKQVNVSMLPPNGGTKDVILTFPSNYDAQLAVKNLDNYVFPFHLDTYVFNAYMERDYNHVVIPPKSSNKPKKFKWSQGQDRLYRPEKKMQSQGRPAYNNQADYRNESFELDKKIEILKKQRMILEEERKLLEEQQRLDKIRMQASNSTKQENLNTPNTKNVQQTQPAKSAKAAKKQVNYFKATGVLVWKMSAHINKYAPTENKKAFLVRLRSTIRDRIRAAVNGEPIYYTNKVIELYRSHHPESEDESFVKELAEQLDDASWHEGDSLNAEIKMEGTNAELDEKIENEPVQDNKTVKSKPSNRKVLYKLGKILLNKLNYHIDQHVSPEKRRIIVKLLRHVLRERLVDIIDDDKPLYGINKTINAYREKHPVEKDEKLVLEVLKKIEDNNWDYDDVNKLYGPTAEEEDGSKEIDEADAGANTSGTDLYDPENPGEEDEDENEDEAINETKDVLEKTDKSAENNEELNKQNDINSIETEKNTKEDEIAKKSTETVNDPVSEDRGIKRRGSVVEEVEEKVAKVSDANENDYEITTDENDLEDWN